MAVNLVRGPHVSRRKFIQGSALAALSPVSFLHAFDRSDRRGSAQRIFSLDDNWQFSRKAQPADFSSVALPHTVTQLSWQKWEPSAWEDVWIYRRGFDVPSAFKGMRIFLHFDRVMTGATPIINGHALPQHLGGFLPFEYEITDLIKEEGNELSIEVDSRWINVPPGGSPHGPTSVDYLLPGGITGSVSLRAVPSAFISDVFAKPVRVLERDRRLDITCQIRSRLASPSRLWVKATLKSGSHVVTEISESITLNKEAQECSLSLTHLENIHLWDVKNPVLYDLTVTLLQDGRPLHDYKTRVGFRDARFELDGFYLNGKRLQLFGLNRHELYPYVGFAASPRALRKDAEILRHTFNCNMVRCSHYPQAEAFLDACDELGLLVWEEIPGWQYIGDESWKQLAIRDVETMIRRDRNHPSIVIWGVRINESPNQPDLYRRTRELAKSLDDSRPTSGTMTPSSRKNWQAEWHQDVFAFDDYHAESDGSVGIDDPLPGVPYMLAETVGQFNYGAKKGFNNKYRRAGDVNLQMQQALYHAQAHDRVAAKPRCAGAIAWCAFDYASLMNAYDAVKCPGIADVFRIPKLGAAFYKAQADPYVQPVIEPAFYWDFGAHTPSGPGAHALIFSNCSRLEVFIGGKQHSLLQPEKSSFPHLKYPPFLADLNIDGSSKPELRIDGYVGSKLVVSRSFSADPAGDRLSLQADDTELDANGSDTTRLVFGVVDKYGSLRAFADGEVTLAIEGPGVLIGDNPFSLGAAGGAGAVWVKTVSGKAGRIVIRAKHSQLGETSVTIRSVKTQTILR